MSKTPLRIAVAGASGRMGRQLIQAVKQSDQVCLGAALIRANSELCGIDAGELADVGTLGVALNDSAVVVKEDFDILIDFTRPEATLEYLNFCCRHNKGMLIGTTGFSESQKACINEASRQIGIVFTANFSIGVNLMLKLLEKAAHVMGRSADIEIIEAHHRNKVDAPSGTALAMAKSIAGVLGHDLASYAIYHRKGHNIGKREANSIGFSTVRAGDIVGEHTVLFAGIGERLEITHKASSRMTFALGVIRAAIWLSGKKSGLFDMVNVLELDKL